MRLEIKIPEVGESVKEAVLAQWFRRDGDRVRKDEILFLLETDKVTLEIVAEADGTLHILEPQGKTVAIGTVIGFLETEAAPAQAPESARVDAPPPASPVPAEKEARPSEQPATATLAVAGASPPVLSPSVRRMVAAKGLDAGRLQGTGPGGRITKGDVLLYLEQTSALVSAAEPGAEPSAISPQPAAEREPASPASPDETEAPADVTAPSCGPFERVTRQPMSRIRLRIAERLLEARQQTAMLTTFNEIDMSALQAERARFQGGFSSQAWCIIGNYVILHQGYYDRAPGISGPQRLHRRQGCGLP